MTEKQQRIYDTLKQHGSGMTPTELARKLAPKIGKDEAWAKMKGSSYVSPVLKMLCKAGMVKRTVPSAGLVVYKVSQ